MPDPQRLIRTLQLATQAFQATPGRLGRFVRLQNVDEVLVVGDLHGNVVNFRQILQKAELEAHPGRHLVLQELIHGPQRHPQGGDLSHRLLDLLAALKCQFPARVHMLLGNHEMAQWQSQEIGKGDESLNRLFKAGVDSAYAADAGRIYEAYLGLFATVPLAVVTPNRVIMSHSFPSASRMETFETTAMQVDALPAEAYEWGGGIHALLWGRDTRGETAARFLSKVDADLVITGHIPCPAGFDAPNDRQLILDALGSPAGYCLFPTNRPLTHADLVKCVQTF
jgi:hypothetical protein